MGWGNAGMSADGRLILGYFPDALERTEGDKTYSGVGLYDRVTGQFEDIFITSDEEPVDPPYPFIHPGAFWPITALAISGNGRYVAFTSAASYVPEDTEVLPDVYLRDRIAGTTELVTDFEGTACYSWPRLSFDGRRILINVYSGCSADGYVNANPVIGYTEEPLLIDLDANDVYRSPVPAFAVQISRDGWHYTGWSYPTCEPGIAEEVVEYDCGSGVLAIDAKAGKADLVSVNDAGESAGTTSGREERLGRGGFHYPIGISEGGRYVAFASNAPNLVPNDPDEPKYISLGDVDIFVRDRLTGRTENVTLDSLGRDDVASPYGFLRMAHITPDGRHVAFLVCSGKFDPYEDPLTPDEIVDIDQSDRCHNSLRIVIYDRETRTRQVIDPRDYMPAQYITLYTQVTYNDDLSVVAWNGCNFTGAGGKECNALGRMFVLERGPGGIGIGDMSFTQDDGILRVNGWAALPGDVLASGVDPIDDGRVDAGGISARDSGGELRGARLIYRPEADDLALEILLDRIPKPRVRTPQPAQVTVDGPAGYGGVVYTVDLKWMFHDRPMQPTPLRIFAGRSGAATPKSWSWDESPFDPEDPDSPRCHAYTVRVPCSFGTYGNSILISLPWNDPDTDLSEVSVRSVRGDANRGGIEIGETIDEIVLPDASVILPRISLGIADEGVPESEVAFVQDVAPIRGTFGGTLSTDGLSAGTYRVWARACVGDVCGSSSRKVVLP